jgi:hypothetical protein
MSVHPAAAAQPHVGALAEMGHTDCSYDPPAAVESHSAGGGSCQFAAAPTLSVPTSPAQKSRPSNPAPAPAPARADPADSSRRPELEPTPAPAETPAADAWAAVGGSVATAPRTGAGALAPLGVDAHRQTAGVDAADAIAVEALAVAALPDRSAGHEAFGPAQFPDPGEGVQPRAAGHLIPGPCEHAAPNDKTVDSAVTASGALASAASGPAAPPALNPATGRAGEGAHSASAAAAAGSRAAGSGRSSGFGIGTSAPGPQPRGASAACTRGEAAAAGTEAYCLGDSEPSAGEAGAAGAAAEASEAAAGGVGLAAREAERERRRAEVEAELRWVRETLAQRKRLLRHARPAPGAPAPAAGPGCVGPAASPATGDGSPEGA